ncbi:MAG: hypothetical protein UX35_C0001G0001 [Microgenomates group bacterium GW2011_GWA1_46_15]|nr:MAG: hypothetical protein UX00_C0003G0090 [Microgenomates group bacterium GW2011_GWB1_45_17]KKU24105.1 MAG: hypothetical protein UX36_C0002G0088 [Microgenomates group bacterium GW2011_GWC1_46_15]KKU24819.1 MAG: hypothetical protein UX35_C0001G0001 [Microgenomates group bacterium GW2011_GWA1_46_15]
MATPNKDALQYPVPPGERESCPKREEYFVLLSPWAGFGAGTIVARRKHTGTLYGVVDGHYPLLLFPYQVSFCF